MIPVYAPMVGPSEADNVLRAINEGEISGSGGRYLAEFEERFANYCGCQFGVAVSSGTAALHVAAVIAGIQRGHEVMVSSLTNIATGNAVAMEGGTIVPIDSEPLTWNLDPDLLEKHFNSSIRGIVVVHVYGHPANVVEIRRFADRHGLFVIEDCAEAHGASFLGRKVGSWGDVGCFSFYVNKVITTGEGGMLVTDNAEIAKEARSLRNLCFRSPRFNHDRLGFNYRMTNFQAAMGVAQIDRIEEILSRKRRVAQRYARRLNGADWLRLPVELPNYRNVYWMYCIVVSPEIGRDRVIERLLQNEIETRTMFCPLNLQPVYRERWRWADSIRTVPCPVAVSLWHDGLYLPSSPLLEEKDIDRICDVILSCV